MGAGAVGSFFGGFLAEGGNDVALIARESHVKAVKQDGLTIEGASGKYIVNVKAVTTPAHLKETFDLILLTVKAYDTRQAVREAQILMGNNSVLLCLFQLFLMQFLPCPIHFGDTVELSYFP